MTVSVHFITEACRISICAGFAFLPGTLAVTETFEALTACDARSALIDAGIRGS